MLTKFLQSHQTSFVIGEIKTETKLNLGLYGILLQQFEIMNASFKLTIEYLQFLLDFMKSIPFTTSSSSETAIIYADVVVNLMFVLKEIFASFSKWRYTYPPEKGEIGNFALLFFFFFFYELYNHGLVVSLTLDGNSVKLAQNFIVTFDISF